MKIHPHLHINYLFYQLHLQNSRLHLPHCHLHYQLNQFYHSLLLYQMILALFYAL